MSSDFEYFYKKEVDWSTLHQGVSIPVDIQENFYQQIDSEIPKGESKRIEILAESKAFKARIINQNFDTNKYPDHKDILQLRWSPKSDFSKYLKKVFSTSYNYMLEMKPKLPKRKKIEIPQNKKEFIAIYTTKEKDKFLVDCITHPEINESIIDFEIVDEQEYEMSINYDLKDASASLRNVLRHTKIRKIDKAIGDTLKKFYNYRCQICGENFGKSYDANIVEAHHIEYFVTSINNDSHNISVVCPNHHRVIHKTHPVFDRENKLFKYPNGREEKLVLNLHL